LNDTSLRVPFVTTCVITIFIQCIYPYRTGTVHKTDLLIVTYCITSHITYPESFNIGSYCIYAL